MKRYLTVQELSEAVQLPVRPIRMMVKAGHVWTVQGVRDPNKARLTVKAWRDFVDSLPTWAQEHNG